MIEGPGAAKLHRGHDYQELISKIFRYSLGWSDLQWASEKYFALPTAPTATWNDGTRPTDGSFVGESGGCIYSMFFVPGSQHSELFIMRPVSERTGRQDSHFTLKIGFRISAVAIDVASKEVVLLEMFLFIFHCSINTNGSAPPQTAEWRCPFSFLRLQQQDASGIILLACQLAL